MARPQIPSPIIASGGRRRRSIGERLLEQALSQLLTAGIQRGLQEIPGMQQQAAGEPPPPSRQRGAQEQVSQNLLRAQGGAKEQSAIRSASPFQPGGAPEGARADLQQRLEELRQTAPERLHILQDQEDQQRVQEALGRARRFLGQITDEGQREDVLGRFDFITAARTAGIDTSLITETLPPSTKDKVDLAQAQLDLESSRTEREADSFATGFLKKQGVLPTSAPDTVPGSSDIMLSLREQAEEEEPNWIQEGVDYILGRIGETQAGTGGGFSVGGQVTAADFLGGDSAVTVEEAIAEFSSFADRFIRAVDPAAADRVMKRLESGAFERTLTKNAATDQLTRILQRRPDMPIEDIRETLKGGFTKDEIKEIIRDAKRRANPATVR